MAGKISTDHDGMYPHSPNTSGGSSSDGNSGPYYVVMVPTSTTTPTITSMPTSMDMASNFVNFTNNNNNSVYAQRRKLTTANLLQTAADLSMANNSQVSATNLMINANQNVIRSGGHDGTGHGNPRDERRRATHNEVERRRRDKINTWISKLGKLIPDCNEDSSKQGQSKGGILSKACDHVNNLTQQVNQLQNVSKQNEAFLTQEIIRLQKEIEELKNENHDLKVALGIDASPDNDQRMADNEDANSRDEDTDCTSCPEVSSRGPQRFQEQQVIVSNPAATSSPRIKNFSSATQTMITSSLPLSPSPS